MHPLLDKCRVVRVALPKTLLPFLRAFGCPSTGSARPLLARAALFPGIIVLIVAWVSLRLVRVVLALVVFLSGAFGHLWVICGFP